MLVVVVVVVVLNEGGQSDRQNRRCSTFEMISRQWIRDFGEGAVRFFFLPATLTFAGGGGGGLGVWFWLTLSITIRKVVPLPLFLIHYSTLPLPPPLMVIWFLTAKNSVSTAKMRKEKMRQRQNNFHIPLTLHNLLPVCLLLHKNVQSVVITLITTVVGKKKDTRSASLNLS